MLRIHCATDLVARPPVSPDLVPARGPFRFPSPYETDATRLTHPDDGVFEHIGYPYWANINNHQGEPNLLVFVGRVGARPLLYSVDKRTLRIEARRELALQGTAERWYFSAVQPTTLYVELVDSRLLRYDVLTDAVEVVFDLADHGYPGHVLWQSHTSHDGDVHSFTVKDPGYQPIGCGVYRESDQRFWFFPAQGAYDECQIDQSGRWLVIKQGDDNRIVDLQTGGATLLANASGAVGHSDMGFGYMVGEDDYASQPGAEHLWRFGPDGNSSDGGIVYHMTGWDTMARHVSHLNARPGSPERQSIIVSSAHRNLALPRANELVRATLDGSLTADVICPTLVDLNAMPGVEDYRKLPMANVDVTGEFVVWSSNLGGDRLDILLVRVPQ